MIKQSRYPVLLFLLTACLLWQACSQQNSPCLQPKNPYVTIHFVHFAQDTSTIPVDTVLPAAIIGAVVPGKNIPPNLYYGAIEQFSGLLSPVADSCKWYITPDTTYVNTYGFDTLTYFYTRQSDFLSNACGFTYFYNIDSVRITKRTHNNLDSVIIENSGVSLNANTENLRIYVHPDYF